MLGYPWPGNVRELRNAIERAILLSDDLKLQLKDFSNLIKSVDIDSHEVSETMDLPHHIIRMEVNYGSTDLKKVEKHYAHEVLEKLGGNKTQTARILGISRPKLDTLLR